MNTKSDDVSGLRSLGSGNTEYLHAGGEVRPDKLETFPNAHMDCEYWVHFEQPEHSSLCPLTKQPDSAVITIDYVPGNCCVESKSLKLYLGSYRNAGVFMETGTLNMAKHLVELLDPIKLIVRGNYAPRGGIRTIVTAKYLKGQGFVPESVLVHSIG